MIDIQDVIDLLKAMIAIPSYSREEKEVADFLQSNMEAMGNFD